MSSLSATIHEHLRCTVVQLLHHHVNEHIKLLEYNASHADMALLTQLTTLRVTKVTSTDPMQDKEAWGTRIIAGGGTNKPSPRGA